MNYSSYDGAYYKSELEEITHQIVVVGFAAVDITSQSTTPAIASATTYPGRNHLSLGGVARNMAECAHRLSSSLPSDSRALSSPVRLVCPVGRDALGSYLLQETKELGMRTDGFLLPKLATGKDGEEQCRTASVSLQLDPAGDLISGVADIDPSTFSAHHVRSHLLPLIERPTTLAIDANLGIGTMAEILATSQSNSNVIACLYEPTSVPKCTALIDAIALLQRGGRLNQLGKNGRGTKWGMDVMTPNEIEVIRMASHLSASQLGHPKDGAASGTAVERFISTEEAERLETDVDVCAAAMALSDASGATLLVKGGHRGVLVVLPASTDGPRMFRVPALKVRGEDIVSTTGAGDTFAGSILVDLALRARQEKQRRSSSPQAEAEHRREDKNWWRGAVERGQRAAAITLTSTLPVSPSLDSARLFDLLHQKLIAPA